MTWTYAGTPETVNRDAVRLLIGDTITTDQLITDEEIAYFIAKAGNINLAAADACEAIAAELGRKVDRSAIDMSASPSTRAAHFLDLAIQLRKRNMRSVTVFAGGMSKDDKIDFAADTDLVQPRFKTGMLDFHGADEDEIDCNVSD